MKSSLEPYVYGDPPTTKVKRKHPSCGHGRGRIVIDRGLRSAWCWGCEKRVATVRIPRVWKRLTRG